MATIAIASVVLTSVLALRKNGTRIPACFPFCGCSSHSSGGHVVIDGTEPHVRESSIAFEDVDVQVGLVDVLAFLLLVVDDLIYCLDPAYRAEAGENAQPVRGDDE